MSLAFAATAFARSCLKYASLAYTFEVLRESTRYLRARLSAARDCRSQTPEIALFSGSVLADSPARRVARGLAGAAPVRLLRVDVRRKRPLFGQAASCGARGPPGHVARAAARHHGRAPERLRILRAARRRLRDLPNVAGAPRARASRRARAGLPRRPSLPPPSRGTGAAPSRARSAMARIAVDRSPGSLAASTSPAPPSCAASAARSSTLAVLRARPHAQHASMAAPTASAACSSAHPPSLGTASPLVRAWRASAASACREHHDARRARRPRGPSRRTGRRGSPALPLREHRPATALCTGPRATAASVESTLRNAGALGSAVKTSSVRLPAFLSSSSFLLNSSTARLMCMRAELRPAHRAELGAS